MFDTEKLKLYIKGNIGKTVGAIMGLVFGILVLSIGFFRSILLFLFIGAGCWVGSRIDNGKRFHSVLDRFNRGSKNNW